MRVAKKITTLTEAVALVVVDEHSDFPSGRCAALQGSNGSAVIVLLQEMGGTFVLHAIESHVLYARWSRRRRWTPKRR